MIDLNNNLGPALEAPGGKVGVKGVAPEGCVSALGTVDLGLSVLQSLDQSPGTTCLEGPLAEQAGAREVTGSDQLTDQMHLGHWGIASGKRTGCYFTEGN